MSTNIKIQRICEHCKKEFIAQTTKTKYCSHICNSRAYKANLKAVKIEKSNIETHVVRNKPVLDLKAKEYMSISEVCLLIGISRSTLYRIIERQELNIGKFGKRTIIRRVDIDLMFKISIPQQKEIRVSEKTKAPEIKDCYTITEVQQKFNISNGALYNLIKRKNINKFSKGKYTYVAKKDIEAIF